MKEMAREGNIEIKKIYHINILVVIYKVSLEISWFSFNFKKITEFLIQKKIIVLQQ